MTPSCVVDASIALSWCFLDESTAATRKLLAAMDHDFMLVPAWWYVELTNALVVAERKGRIDAERIGEFVGLVESFQIEVDDEGPRRAFDHLLPLCRQHQLSTYDATYLDLALRRKRPLATLDEPLRKAAKKLGIKLLGK